MNSITYWNGEPLEVGDFFHQGTPELRGGQIPVYRVTGLSPFFVETLSVWLNAGLTGQDLVRDTGPYDIFAIYEDRPFIKLPDDTTWESIHSSRAFY